MNCTLSSPSVGLDDRPSGHDGNFLLRQVAAPGSTGPLGGTLAPLLGELAPGGWPCGQLAQHKLASRRHSRELLLVLQRRQMVLTLLHRRVAFQIIERSPRWRSDSAQRWWPDNKCADDSRHTDGLRPGVNWWSLHAFAEHVGRRCNNWGRWDAQLVGPSRGVEHLVEGANQVGGVLVVEPLLDVHLAQHADCCHFAFQSAF
eukprot:scaffold121181_cov63-Phaeocystis_antarctica.AAC.3